MRSNRVVVVPGCRLAARRPGALCSRVFPCQTGAHGHKASIPQWLCSFVAFTDLNLDKQLRPLRVEYGQLRRSISVHVVSSSVYILVYVPIERALFAFSCPDRYQSSPAVML